MGKKEESNKPTNSHLKTIDREISNLRELGNLKLGILEDSLSHHIRVTTTLIKIATLEKFKSFNQDITPEQWQVLNVIAESPGIIQRELGDRTLKNRPTITRILDLLEKKELVVRKPNQDDRRVIRIHLSAKGTRVTKQYSSAIQEVDRIVMGGLSQKEISSLKGTLSKIRQNISPSLSKKNEK